jgi:hypothetical protein
MLYIAAPMEISAGSIPAGNDKGHSLARDGRSFAFGGATLSTPKHPIGPDYFKP